MSQFKLQIIDKTTGKVVNGWQPGDRVETDLAEDLLNRLKGRKLGFRTQGKILKAVAQEFAEMLLDLKQRASAPPRPRG